MFKGIKALKKVFSNKSKRDRHDSASESNLLVENEYVNSDGYLNRNVESKKGMSQRAKKIFKRVILRKKKYSWAPETPAVQLTGKKEVNDKGNSEISMDDFLFLKEEFDALEKKLEEKEEELKNVKKMNRDLRKFAQNLEVELAESETDIETYFQLLRSNMYRTVRQQQRHRKEMKKAQETIRAERLKTITLERKCIDRYRKRKVAEERICELEEEVHMLRVRNWRDGVNERQIPATSTTYKSKNAHNTFPTLKENMPLVSFRTANGNIGIPNGERMQKWPHAYMTSRK